MKRYESRYCTFAVPDDWVPEPPFVFCEVGEPGNRIGTQILERCFASISNAVDYAKQQRQVLSKLYNGFELLREGSQQLEGPGEGYFFVFRFLDEDDNHTRGKTIYFTCGPLVCQLVLTGPDGPNIARDRLFEAVGSTFSFQQTDFIAGAKSGDLISEILRSPHLTGDQSWIRTWQKFPRCCVCLPVPSGWAVAEDNGDALLRRGSAEIRLHRELGRNVDLNTWYADRLRRFQENGDRLLRSESSKTEIWPYAALLYEEKGMTRNWKTAATMLSLDLFLANRPPLTWRLNASEASFADFQRLLESLARTARVLNTNEWETKVTEPWLDVTLLGPWETHGSGVYANMDRPPVLVNLSRQKSSIPLLKIHANLAKSLLKSAQLMAGYSETINYGAWMGYDAFQYSLEGTTDNSETFGLRAIWLASQDTMYSIVIKSSKRIDELFRSFTGSLAAHLKSK